MHGPNRTVHFICSEKMEKTDATQGNGVRAHGGVASAFPGRPRGLPRDVRRILIVGAGGFGREVFNWASDAWPDRSDAFAGFLAEDCSKTSDAPARSSILGSPSTYDPIPGDGILLAIGIPGVRRRVAELLESRGARFLTLIHPSAIVAPTALVREGSVLCPYAVVSDRARVGRCALLNYHSSLGHDASTGDFAVLSPYATLGGNAHVHDDVFMGLHATVGPGRTIGRNSKISANSCALSDAPPESIIYGSPGRLGPLIQ
jgi:sugar O-acyltransferase (sialic acid O-acetyltransferase NeuD family)